MPCQPASGGARANGLRASGAVSGLGPARGAGNPWTGRCSTIPTEETVVSGALLAKRAQGSRRCGQDRRGRVSCMQCPESLRPPEREAAAGDQPRFRANPGSCRDASPRVEGDAPFATYTGSDGLDGHFEQVGISLGWADRGGPRRRSRSLRAVPAPCGGCRERCGSRTRDAGRPSLSRAEVTARDPEA